MIVGTELLEALPVAVYVTDAEGRVTFYNAAAAQLWGWHPVPGTLWCGAWRLFRPDGRPLAHAECPMAEALREGNPVRECEAVLERPGGTRVPFLPYPTPLKDDSGRVIGGINVLIDLTERKRAEIETERLAAIVASSDDAIISKTLQGRITSWNEGASRIFGYEADEIIGQPIQRIVPPELHGEENEILAKLQRGERIDHFDTVRVTKDGRRIDISLTVSPLRDKSGRIVGASKVARDVTERKRTEELQHLLLSELNHRVKNTLATIQAIAAQSLLRAASPAAFVANFNGRVQALARAHDLLVRRKMKGADMREIVREQVVLGAPEAGRIAYSGPDLTLDSRLSVQLSLVLHELATNARKYGALSCPSGRLSIGWKLVMQQAGRELLIQWEESGVPAIVAPRKRGFGTTLIERTIESGGGTAAIRYGSEGVVCEIRLPLPEESDEGLGTPATPNREPDRSTKAREPRDLRGKRILVIEDEPIVAMEIESHLLAAGCELIGPAGTVARAIRLIADVPCDAALVDANLGGRPVDVIVAALAQKGIPFAFATGYGREALPRGFRDAALLLKPFGPERLLDVVGGLFDQERGSDVISLRQRRNVAVIAATR